MRAPRTPFLTGLVTALVLVAVMMGVFVSGIPAGPQIPLPWNQKATLHVQLADADALAPHASVQMAGVKVGEVQSVDAQGNVAVATLLINQKYSDIHSNATIYLRPHGLFGPKYIDIVPGTAAAPRLHDGDTITVAQTVQPVDLNAILQDLQAPEQQNLRTLFVELGQASAGQGSDVNHMLAAADSLSQVLDSPLKALDKVGPQLNDFIVKNESFNAAFAQTPLDQLVANSEQTVRAFANNASHLDSLVIHADSVLTQVDAALGGESANITKTVQLLGKQGGTVDKLSSFTYLLGLLGANLLNKDTSDPHDIFAVNGINGAIDNVQSAFASSDACPKPLSPANHCSVSPDGRQHYLRVQTFNFPPSFCGLPLFSGGGGPIPCPSSSSGAPSVPFRAALTGDELNSLGAFLAS